MKIARYCSDEPYRGRPRGRHSSSSSFSLCSVAQVAAKYSMEPSSLLDAFTEAWLHKEFQYDKLEIVCRGVDNDFANFLITCGDKVVCQFPVGIEILQEPEIFKPYIPTIPVPICKDDSIKKSISDLRNNMRAVTVKGRILEIPQKRLVDTRFGGYAFVSNVLLADETGTIRFSLWNNQIDEVAVGDTVSIEKASVTLFCGEPHLKLGRSGTMSIDSMTREQLIV
ncbi:MAG: hypothetical protein QG670_69 [Thermoproteota archaeon]|nr:hypothetical protein [Thermoproteota archaeon]